VRTTWILGVVYLLGLLGCSEPKRFAPAPFNQAAALTGEMPYDPLHFKVLTSAVSRKDSSIYTVFGNDRAIEYARSHLQGDYPVGSVISLVTWKQKGDPHWFGGLIPGQAASVEFVIVEAGANQIPQYVYVEYRGTPLKKMTSQPEMLPSDRAAYLLAQRAAFLP